MTYLAGVAGVVEGVDVLGAETHLPAVDSIEIGAPGGVAGVAAAAREVWRGALRCRRPQEPGQRTEQRDLRAPPHGGRRARPRSRAPWREGERRAGSPKAPCWPGRPLRAAPAMPGQPGRRVLAVRWPREDPMLMQLPGVSTGDHRLEEGWG